MFAFSYLHYPELLTAAFLLVKSLPIIAKPEKDVRFQNEMDAICILLIRIQRIG